MSTNLIQKAQKAVSNFKKIVYTQPISKKVNNKKLDLNGLWKPFTANKHFKKNPRLIVKGEGMYYIDNDGRKVLDAISGLWCCNLGNSHPAIQKAISDQVHQLYYSTAFQLGHLSEFELANEILSVVPHHLKKIFYGNSGSEAVETSLKIALAYHKARGNGSKTLIIGRHDGYHGVNFGGISVGGMVNNRKAFNNRLKVDHLPSMLDIERNAFSRGIPEHGAEKAEVLLDLINLHGADNIAAVIVEAVAGSGGVYISPKNYLTKLQKICNDHDILLILDEVITGFGRTGNPFASHTFGVEADMITMAKGLTAGSIPMSAVALRNSIYDTIVDRAETPIELFHGYTYSGHPMGCAAGLAAIRTYKDEKLFERVASLSKYWEDRLHSLQGLPNVIDIRNIGFMGAIHFKSRNGQVGARATELSDQAYSKGISIRTGGDVVALCPAYIVTEEEIDYLITTLASLIKGIK